MGDLTGSGFIYCRKIALTDKLGVSGGIFAQIIEPALEHQDPVLRGGVAEGEVVGLGGRAGPILHPTTPTIGWDDGDRRLLASADRRRGGRRRGLLKVGWLLRDEGGERGLGDDLETAG